MMIVPITAALAVPALAAGWYLAPMVARRRQEQRLHAACRSTRSLVLTYDDGPGPRLTPRLLDLLATHDARATFFLAGFRATRRPDLVDRVVRAGHEVGCHSHRHLNAWHSTPWRAVADVAHGYRSLAPWVPANGIFRPPYGKMTVMTWAEIKRRRAPLGWWTIEAGDVREQLPDPDAGAKRARNAGGGVVLLHDFDRGAEREAFVLEATRYLLETAREEGWTIRTLSEVESAVANHR